MKGKIIKSLEESIRKIPLKSQLKFLEDWDLEECLPLLIGMTYLYTRPTEEGQEGAPLAELSTGIGRELMKHFQLKRDSGKAAKIGGLFLYSLEDVGLTELALSSSLSNKHGKYRIRVVDAKAFAKLWRKVAISKGRSIPHRTPYPPWQSAWSSKGDILVKTGDKELLKGLSPKRQPLLFKAVNRLQKVGWRINFRILRMQMWALEHKAPAFNSIWAMVSREARASKRREVTITHEIAKDLLGVAFYHRYYFDFRSRIYPATAYLHEQGSDVAKGLLLRDVGKPLGREGFRWLLIAIATKWAGAFEGSKTDKIPLSRRFEWGLLNLGRLVSFGLNPKVNKDWMEADSPWQFLSYCQELSRFLMYWHEKQNYDYISNVVLYIDGSTNGLQHLSALTRDADTAAHVNLKNSKTPGDLYAYIGSHLWKQLQVYKEDMDADEIKECYDFIETLESLKAQMYAYPTDDPERFKLRSTIHKFKEENPLVMRLSSPLFWLRIEDLSHIRKIVKRNVMTLPYGGSAYGLGQQIIDDARKHNISALLYLENSWGAFLGRETHAGCQVALGKPMTLLSVFEQAGKAAEKDARFLSWVTPKVNFPVVQYYVEGTVKKVWVPYGPNEGLTRSTGFHANSLQLNICFLEETQRSRGKQSQGAAPNIIHSLDATHLILTINACNFAVSTVHDSFGCLAADMDVLFRVVREQFVVLYEENPLEGLLTQIGAPPTPLEIGDFDINAVLKSEYCFS